MLETNDCPDFGILARPQHVSGIRKLTHELNGARALVHLTIGKQEFPLMCIGCSIRQDQLELQALELARAAHEPEVFLLAEGKLGLDRVNR